MKVCAPEGIDSVAGIVTRRPDSSSRLTVTASAFCVTPDSTRSLPTLPALTVMWLARVIASRRIGVVHGGAGPRATGLSAIVWLGSSVSVKMPRTPTASSAAATSFAVSPENVAVKAVGSFASCVSGKSFVPPARRSRRPFENGFCVLPMMRVSMLATGSGVPSGAAARPWTTTVPGAVFTAREVVMSSTVFVSTKSGPVTRTTSPGRMSGVASVQQSIVPPFMAPSPAASVVSVPVASWTPSRVTSIWTDVEPGKPLSSRADVSGSTVIVWPATTTPPPPPPPLAAAPDAASAAVRPAASSAAPAVRTARARARSIVPCRPTLATPVPVRSLKRPAMLLRPRERGQRGTRTPPCGIPPTAAPDGRSAAHVDRADAARLDRDDDAPVAGLVVGGDVGAVLAVQLAGERVVVVGLDPRAPAHLEVAHRVLEVEDQQAALRPRLEILRLAPGGVQRQADLALVVEEPDLAELRRAVGLDGRERRDLGVEEVAEVVRVVGHAAHPPTLTRARSSRGPRAASRRAAGRAGRSSAGRASRAPARRRARPAAR